MCNMATVYMHMTPTMNVVLQGFVKKGESLLTETKLLHLDEQK
jgi:hypothetical protein